jgi:hypothetical protein
MKVALSTGRDAFPTRKTLRQSKKRGCQESTTLDQLEATLGELEKTLGELGKTFRQQKKTRGHNEKALSQQKLRLSRNHGRRLRFAERPSPPGVSVWPSRRPRC